MERRYIIERKISGRNHLGRHFLSQTYCQARIEASTTGEGRDGKVKAKALTETAAIKAKVQSTIILLKKIDHEQRRSIEYLKS